MHAHVLQADACLLLLPAACRSRAYELQEVELAKTREVLCLLIAVEEKLTWTQNGERALALLASCWCWLALRRRSQCGV